MQIDFEPQLYVFPSRRSKTACRWSLNRRNPTGIFSDWESNGPRRQGFAQNPTTWPLRSSDRKRARSKNSRDYLRQQAVAERSMYWMVTQLYSDVASRPTRCRRAARPPVARRLSAGANSGLEIKRSALGAHVSVDTCSDAWNLPAV